MSARIVRLARIASVIIVLAGISFRFVGLFNDLWLDEIWALNAASSMDGPTDLFAARNLDGHSSLYTLIMFGLGEGFRPEVYRLFSFVCGVGTLVLIWIGCRREGPLAQFLVLLLSSFSYLLVLYGSEARGYGPLIFFSALSLYFLHRAARQLRLNDLLAFWISCVAAFFFHFTFVQYYAAAAVCSSLYLWRTHRKLTPAAKLHLVPVGIILATYLLVIRGKGPGSGPIGSYWDVIIDTINITFGAPLLSPLTIERDVWLLAIACVILALLAIEIFLERLERPIESLFFLLMLFVVPALLVLLLQPKVLVVRYFLLSTFFALPLAARLLERLARRGAVGLCLSILLVISFVYGQGSYLIRFARWGRGTYGDALTFMKSNASGPVIVAGDHDFRNAMLVEYFSSRLGMDDEVVYVPKWKDGREAEWYLLHSQDPAYCPVPELTTEEGSRFVLQGTFPFTALSGWSWFVYRRVR